MLFDFAAAPESRERWAAALHDGRAETRAATARVVSVAGATPLLPEVVSALEAETAEDAARELMRAAAALGGSKVDPALFGAVARRHGDLVEVLTEILGRRWTSRDSSFVWPSPAMSRSMGAVAASTVGTGEGPRGAQEGRGALTRMGTVAVRDKNAELFAVVLKVAAATGTDIDVGILRAALQTELREVTCWYLAQVEPRRLASELGDDAMTPTSTEGDPSFGCEILGRILERPIGRLPERDWTSPLGRDTAKRLPITRAVLEVLTPEERRALSRARGYEEDILDRTLEGLKQPRERAETAPPKATDSSDPDAIRLLDLSTFPRGFVQDVVALTGCKGAPFDVWGGAEITYQYDGRPLNVALFRGNDALGACRSAARLLFATALAPDGRAPRRGERHVVFVRLDRDTLACALPPAEPAQGRSGSEGLPRVGGHIREPKKTRHVSPIYPSSAKQARVQGIVVIEAVIAPSGCIRGLNVLRHVDPALDMAALRAVADWRYTPTLLNGVPVPVIMTVTVNFRLQ